MTAQVSDGMLLSPLHTHLGSSDVSLSARADPWFSLVRLFVRVHPKEKPNPSPSTDTWPLTTKSVTVHYLKSLPSRLPHFLGQMGGGQIILDIGDLWSPWHSGILQSVEELTRESSHRVLHTFLKGMCHWLQESSRLTSVYHLPSGAHSLWAKRSCINNLPCKVRNRNSVSAVSVENHTHGKKGGRVYLSISGQNCPFFFH